MNLVSHCKLLKDGHPWKQWTPYPRTTNQQVGGSSPSTPAIVFNELSSLDGSLQVGCDQIVISVLGFPSFRATGITAYLENGGTIENAQAIAAHESPRTTKLYHRTSDEITLDAVERIAI